VFMSMSVLVLVWHAGMWAGVVCVSGRAGGGCPVGWDVVAHVLDAVEYAQDFPAIVQLPRSCDCMLW
jgi:hypothetical protein